MDLFSLVGLEAGKVAIFQSRIESKVQRITRSLSTIIKHINEFIASENGKCNDPSMPRAKRNILLSINLELFDKLRRVAEEIQFSLENGMVGLLQHLS